MLLEPVGLESSSDYLDDVKLTGKTFSRDFARRMKHSRAFNNTGKE